MSDHMTLREMGRVSRQFTGLQERIKNLGGKMTVDRDSKYVITFGELSGGPYKHFAEADAFVNGYYVCKEQRKREDENDAEESARRAQGRG